jgi:hypothetical protein
MAPRLCALVALTIVAGVVVAQAPLRLPKSLNGSWSAQTPGGRANTNVMSVTLDPPSATGDVTGRYTSRGVVCGAIDEPLTGTWNGTELRFESLVHPNVNVNNRNGDCGTGRIVFVLTRAPGQTRFNGESVRDGGRPAQITLDP